MICRNHGPYTDFYIQVTDDGLVIKTCKRCSSSASAKTYRKGKANVKIRKTNREKRIIVSEYVFFGKTYKDISIRYNVPISTIFSWVKSFNTIDKKVGLA